MNNARATTVLRAAILAALCLLVYATGLTTQGLTSWQESTRALVAREMQRSGAYLAPTMRGEPYIAKPPMIYWAQIALARVRGDEVGAWHLRAVVAIAGTLGVLATFFVARRMFRDALDPPRAERAAWWSALGLAVSILYVRSSRIGELDILLVPFVVVAVGAFHAAWRHAERTKRTHLGAVGLCALSAIGAALVKGPPGIACIAVVMLAAPMLPAEPESDATRRARRVGALVGAVAVLAGSVVLHGLSARDVPGLALLGVMGAASGWTLAGLCSRGAFKAWFLTLARTHPVGVLGAPIVVLALWGAHLKRVFGGEVIRELAQREVANNLNVLLPEAATKNLGFLLYGPAPIVLATLAAMIVLATRRERATECLRVLIAWAVGAFIIYSVAGKGVARYLTPLWPACAMLGGWFLDRMLARATSDAARRRLVMLLWAVVVIAAGGHAWWYGLGRAAHNESRSVRALARELAGLDPGAVATWKFDDPALDLYLDRPVRVLGERGDDPIASLSAMIAERGAVTLLVREPTDAVVRKYGDAVAEVRAARLEARPVAISAVYERVSPPSRVLVFVVSDDKHGFPPFPPLPPLPLPPPSPAIPR